MGRTLKPNQFAFKNRPKAEPGVLQPFIFTFSGAFAVSFSECMPEVNTPFTQPGGEPQGVQRREIVRKFARNPETNSKCQMPPVFLGRKARPLRRKIMAQLSLMFRGKPRC